jgi:hypothetical protein
MGTTHRHSGCNTTSNLINHVTQCNAKHDIRPQQQVMSAFASGLTYTRERLRTLTVRWVAGRRRPMSIVDDPEFLDIIKLLHPQAAVPSRITVGRDIKMMYTMTKANVRNIIQVSNHNSNGYHTNRNC